MSNKNIALIRNAQPYDFGGGERFPVFLAVVLKTQKYNPIILSRSQKLLRFAQTEHVQTVRSWWWAKQGWSGLWVGATPLYLAWQVALFFYYLVIFKKQAISIAHVQSKDDFIAATYAAKVLHIRVVWTDHADLKHIFKNVTIWYKNPIGKLVAAAAKHADSITVVSESEKQLLLKNFIKEPRFIKKITVVYNGAFDVFSSYPKRPHEDIVFASASRLVKDKGITELIEAFKVVHEKHNNTKLLLLGDGNDKNKFIKQAGDTPEISFLGHQDNPFSTLSQADIFVHPTYHEGFSLSLVEAAMLQLTTIATNVGGNPEIIKDQDTGLLVPAKNSKALSAAMIQLVEDIPLRTRLAQNARRQYLEKFQFDVIVKNEFIKLYEDAS